MIADTSGPLMAAYRNHPESAITERTVNAIMSTVGDFKVTELAETTYALLADYRNR
ncbi:Hypothetical protein CINCED_3A016352 [Cinara cedri]|uniref:Uncharacterized protein n=1 Tax=Cinara cedri TaxID=506608 RepID=A0A5E4N3T6_9HEMI|nr:Hypothetical protein CINCED_3A016352 [Cinara cedri]